MDCEGEHAPRGPISHPPKEQSDWMTRSVDRLRRTPCAGIILALISGIFFATAGFIVKLIPNVNAIEIVISRGFVQLIAYMPIILIKRWPIFGAPGESLILIARGFCGSIDLIFCYVAYRMIPLSDATTIVFSAPVFVYIFACLLLKEECGVFQIITVLVTLVGVLLIAKPAFMFGTETMPSDSLAGSRTEGTIIAFVSCIVSAMSFVLIRKLRKSPTAVVINAYSMASIVSAVIAIAVIRNFFMQEAGDLALGVGVPETWQEIGFMIGNGMCGVMGQLCLVVALKIEEANLVSLARTIDIVMSFVYQIIWLPNEIVHWTSLLGAIIVCTCVAISAIRRWLVDKPGKWDTLWYILNCSSNRPTRKPSQIVHGGSF